MKKKNILQFTTTNNNKNHTFVHWNGARTTRQQAAQRWLWFVCVGIVVVGLVVVVGIVVVVVVGLSVGVVFSVLMVVVVAVLQLHVVIVLVVVVAVLNIVWMQVSWCKRTHLLVVQRSLLIV